MLKFLRREDCRKCVPRLRKNEGGTHPLTDRRKYRFFLGGGSDYLTAQENQSLSKCVKF